jgi:hypothetical protein
MSYTLNLKSRSDWRIAITQILANQMAFEPSHRTVLNYPTRVQTILSIDHQTVFQRTCRALPPKSLQQNTNIPMENSAMAIAVAKTPLEASIFLRISASAKGLGLSDP